MPHPGILAVTVQMPAVLAALLGLLAVRTVLPASLAGALATPRLWGRIGIVGLAAFLVIAPRMDAPGLVPWATTLTLVSVLGWFPLLVLGHGTDRDSPRRLTRGLWLALAAIGLLVVAESFQRTFGVSRTLVLQAVDQVGEVRLADLRAGLQDPPLSRSLLVQLLLVFPFFVIVWPIFVPGGPLLWPTGLIPILQYFWTAATGLLAVDRTGRHPEKTAPLIVLALVIALHPVVLDKSSWDFIPPGLLLFVIAWLLERKGSRWGFALALGLASWSHPSQAVMAALWAADHARRNWATVPPDQRRRLLGVPAVVWGMAAIPVLAMAIPALVHPEGALLNHLAPYARRKTAALFQAGSLAVLGWVVVSNLLKLAVLFGSLGLLPVLRLNRFLAYGAFEMVYSLFTSNGFIHGSLPGCLGLLACATLENVSCVSPARLRSAAVLAAVLLLPLTVWWSPQHMAVQLLRNSTEQRLAVIEALLTPEDRQRTCIGQAATYTVLAGRCGGEGVLRLPDGRPGANARDGDVYLLDLSPPPWSPESAGLREWIERPRWGLPQGGALGESPLDFQGEPVPEDLQWLKERVAGGELVITRNEGGRIRLDRRAPPQRPPGPVGSPGP